MDGTKGLLNKTNNFTVNIAFINNREPELGVIYSPISGELFYTSPDRESFKYNFLKKTEKVKISGNLENREALTLITTENNLVGRESKILKVDCGLDTLKKLAHRLSFVGLQKGKRIFIKIWPNNGVGYGCDHAILKYAGELPD